MHQLPFDQLVLVVAQTVLLVVLTIRMWSAELIRVYPYFFGYLLAQLLQTGIMSVVPFKGHAYPRMWVATEGILACFSALVVFELYRVILRDLRGIASTSRRYIQVAVAIGICLSLLVFFRWEEIPANYVSTFLVIERGLDCSLLLSILLVTAFLVIYPVPLNRNVVVYSIGYAAYFLAKSTALLIRTLGYPVSPQISTVMLVVSPACLLFLVLGLNRQGETHAVVLGHPFSREDEERLLSKIKEINEDLLEVAHK